MSDQRIIIVEDEDKIARVLMDYLAKDGLLTIVLNDSIRAFLSVR